MLISEERPALLIIDMQNAFLHEQGHLVKLSENNKPYLAIVPNIARLADVARSLKIPVIYLRHAYRRGYIDGGILVHELFPSDKEAGGWLDGTWDTEIFEPLKPKDSDIVIKKNRYSGFFGTDLDQLLRNLGCNTLIITGIHSNVCCDSTARDAVFRDYRVYFVSDATAAADESLHAATLRNIERYFGRVVTTDEVIEHLLRLKGGERGVSKTSPQRKKEGGGQVKKLKHENEERRSS
ncbi:MAG: isochorismatase family protein [Candidatus Hadarchaeum sp.]|uniref:isochorismatase family protein n=1 Tax=Candidatus Hadarchaeum sp. TaxID=2883567 RepID=UPI003D0D3104